jgi:hypothetical protein
MLPHIFKIFLFFLVCLCFITNSQLTTKFDFKYPKTIEFDPKSKTIYTEIEMTFWLEG